MVYGQTAQSEADATVAAAIDGGVTLFDTADVYDRGDSELRLGRSLNGRRHQVTVATKFGIVGRNADGTLQLDNSERHLRAACDASLQRLGTDVIDLYYLHRFDPAIAIEDTVGAMARLVEAGKVRNLGLSEVCAATLTRAHAVHPIAAVQSEYSLWTRGVEVDVLPTCAVLGVALVAYSPLGRGFLAGSVSKDTTLSPGDLRRTVGDRFDAAAIAQNQVWLDVLRQRAAAKGVGVGQLALAWLLHQSPLVIPIPGTRRPQRAADNAAAADIVLDDTEHDALAAVLDQAGVTGRRYSPAMLEQLGC